jgi:hypothetical protein
VGLPDSRGQEIRIIGLAAAAGQRHVAGPGVPSPLGPANQEDGIWIGDENDGD